MTSVAGLPTIPAMSSKWFIPMSLGVFALIVGGPWLYLSITQERSGRATTGRSADILHDPAFVGLAERTPPKPVSEPEAQASGKTPKEINPLALDSVTDQRALPTDPQFAIRNPKSFAPPTARQVAALVADRLDEASVKLRTDLDKSSVTQFVRGASAAQEGKLDDALARFDQAIQRDPENISAHAARASILVAQGRFAEAADAWAEVVRRSPKDAASRYNLAVVLFRLGRNHEAATQLREVIAIDPDHAPAHYNLASLAQREGRLREARDAWETFTRLRPEVASAWFNLGVAYIDLDQPVEAVACFSVLAQLTPEDADAHLNLGIASAMSGQFDAALAALQRADALAPCDETITRYLVALHDLVADHGGPKAAQHRQLAVMLQEQVENTWESP